MDRQDLLKMYVERALKSARSYDTLPTDTVPPRVPSFMLQHQVSNYDKVHPNRDRFATYSWLDLLVTLTLTALLSTCITWVVKTLGYSIDIGFVLGIITIALPTSVGIQNTIKLV